jgi:hypothetical protein
VQIVGLYALLYGKRRNLSIVHTGNIAMMPGDELIPTRDRGNNLVELEGYIVEAQTLRGCSGSPVFVRETVDTIVRRTQPRGPFHDAVAAVAGQIRLLGVWQASWDGKPDDVIAVDRNITNRPVPVGMGIVAPAHRMREVMMLPEAVADRRKEAQERDLDRAATFDSAMPDVSAESPKAAADENPNHLEDFNRLVSAASKRKPKGDRT